MSTRLSDSERVEEIFGSWPKFHDAEILTLVLDRVGPTLSILILIGKPLNAEHQDRTWTFFEIGMRFHDVDSLELSEFNHQNVISYLALSSTIEERPSKLATEERVKVEIDSVWGLRGSFTCSGGEVTSIEETDLSTGNPSGAARKPGDGT